MQVYNLLDCNSFKPVKIRAVTCSYASDQRVRILGDGFRYPATYVDEDDDETGYSQSPGDHHESSVELKFIKRNKQFKILVE